MSSPYRRAGPRWRGNGGSPWPEAARGREGKRQRRRRAEPRGSPSHRRYSTEPRRVFPPRVRAFGGVDEIGRASCRERVEISVVAGSLKKKKKEQSGQHVQ